jgi:capsid protein
MLELKVPPQNRSWVTSFEVALDRVVGLFNPEAEIARGLARHKCAKLREYRFNYDAARPGIYRQQASLVGNASPDTPTINYDRIRVIWEARDLEQNFPFVAHCFNVMENYVLGDFRMKSKATDEADREAIDAYWELAQKFFDPQGRETLHDMARLVLHSCQRDGDDITVFELSKFDIGDTEMEFYQLYIVEADRIGYPYEASYGNGYLNGVFYDVDTGFIKSYHVYQRDPVSNAYVNPQVIDSRKCLYIGNTKRVDGLRCVSEIAASIPTARDIQEAMENERLREKYLSAQAGVVESQTGDQSTDVDIYTDPFANGTPYPQEKVQSAKPAAVTYLAPGESFKPFDMGQASPMFQGLAESMYRDCCMDLSLPYGFVYKPTTNGVAARLESAQAKRTFQRWQRVMRDKWLMPIWNRVMQHGFETGQLVVSAQGAKEISKVKIIWPAHPSVDVGRESTANVAEFNANLKAGESIAEERGDDYDEMMDQKKYEARKERNSVGLIESVINNLGPKGADGLFQLYGQVSGGQIPPENARLMLETLFGLSPEEAAAAIPQGFKVNPPPMPGQVGQPGAPKPPAAQAVSSFSFGTPQKEDLKCLLENLKAKLSA